MNADELPPQTDPYRCPGEQHPISRAVHLGRLAAFYPACRQCPHRDETGTLSPRRVAQLAETNRRGQPRSLFHEEGAGGVYLNDLSPAAAKDIAAAFGTVILEDARAEGLGTSVPSEAGTILLAGDGRPLTAELVAAAAEGLRSTGCNVVDVGPSTAPCLAFAVHHLQAAGGVLVGNPGEDSHTAGMKFWAAGPWPLSAGGSLEPIIQRHQAGDCPNFRGRRGAAVVAENGTVPFRPARQYGQLRRFQADQPYLAQMAEHYHALRPLRVVVDSASRPTIDFLQRLAATVACEITPTRSTRSDLPRQIRDDAAHFAACIDGDGETCRVLDEQGRAVPPERVLLLLAVSAKLAQTIVLEIETSPAVANRLEQQGIPVARSSPRRADMAAAMLKHGAALGGGPSGRFWHSEAGLPLGDALMTVTRLLIALSRGDEPLSKVLDRDASFG